MSDTTTPAPGDSAEASRDFAPSEALPAAPTAPPAQAAAPPENALRGLLFALPVIPVGIVAWVILWQWGFIASIVALGIAVAAAWLYRRGSGGRVGPAGVAVITATTLVTLALAFLGGVASDVAQFLAIPLLAALGDPQFWDTYALNVFDNPDMWAGYVPDILLSVAFAALGTFGVFRGLAREAKAAR